MNDAHNLPPTLLQEKSPSSLSIHLLFSQLNPNDIEQFTHAYHAWTLHQRVAQLSLQISQVHQEIEANKERLHLFQPTTLALSTLAQLQAHGVSNIDLLDRLHTRGEAWLDQALQLLEHCERLDLIQGDYTQWCEHALEGAYDWLSSIDEEDLSNAENGIDLATSLSTEAATTPDNTLANETETLLLRKLFSDTGDLPTPEKTIDATIPQQAFPGEELETAQTPLETEQIPTEDTITTVEEMPISPLTLDQPEPILENPAQEQTHTSETPGDILEATLAHEKGTEHEATLAHEKGTEHKEHITIPEIPSLEDSQTPTQEEKEQNSQRIREPREDAELANDSAPHNTIEPPNDAADEQDAATPNTADQDEPIIIIANEQSNAPNGKERQGSARPAKQHGFIHRLVGRFFPKG